MKLQYKAEHLAGRIEEIKEEAAGHKKAVRYHRRRLKECLSLAEKYEKELAEYGIKLEVHKKTL